MINTKLSCLLITLFIAGNLYATQFASEEDAKAYCTSEYSRLYNDMLEEVREYCADSFDWIPNPSKCEARCKVKDKYVDSSKLKASRGKSSSRIECKIKFNQKVKFKCPEKKVEEHKVSSTRRRGSVISGDVSISGNGNNDITRDDFISRTFDWGKVECTKVGDKWVCKYWLKSGKTFDKGAVEAWLKGILPEGSWDSNFNFVGEFGPSSTSGTYTSTSVSNGGGGSVSSGYDISIDTNRGRGGCSAGYSLCGGDCLSDDECAYLKLKYSSNSKDCVNCRGGYQEHWTSGVANILGAISGPLAIFGSNAMWANAYKAGNQAWANACSSGVSNYLNYVSSNELPAITPSQMSSLQCNGYGMGGYAGGTSMWGNGFGGFGNSYLGAGYSPNFMMGMYGPYGNYGLGAGLGFGIGGNLMGTGLGMGMYPGYGYGTGTGLGFGLGLNLGLGGMGLGSGIGMGLPGFGGGMYYPGIGTGYGVGINGGINTGIYPYGNMGMGSYWNGSGGWGNTGYYGNGYGYGNYYNQQNDYMMMQQQGNYDYMMQQQSLYANYAQAANALNGNSNYGFGNQYGATAGFNFGAGFGLY